MLAFWDYKRYGISYSAKQYWPKIEPFILSLLYVTVVLSLELLILSPASSFREKLVDIIKDQNRELI